MFSAGQERRCVNVTILDDNLLEGPEDFEATLETLMPRVTLNPERSTINIGDDDGTCIKCLVR